MDSNSDKNFPYVIELLSSEENQELSDSMRGILFNEYLRVGPKGYFLPKNYIKDASKIYNFEIRNDDVFVVTFPKSGTTMMQELVWLIINNFDYEKAKSITLNERFPFLEMLTFLGNKPLKEADNVPNIKMMKFRNIDEISELPSPRFIKSHLPLSLLPPTLLDTAKVVYVARDPRDVVVSYYHHHKLMKVMAEDVEFKPFWNYFMASKVKWAPYFDHLLEAWEKRNHSNMMILFYEELSKDLPEVARRVAQFLGKHLSDDHIIKLQEHLKFDNFKNNKAVNMEEEQKHGLIRSDEAFIRKGKIGGWRDYFDEEMTAQAEKWIEDNLRDTDFRFPQL